MTIMEQYYIRPVHGETRCIHHVAKIESKKFLNRNTILAGLATRPCSPANSIRRQ